MFVTAFGDGGYPHQNSDPAANTLAGIRRRTERTMLIAKVQRENNRFFTLKPPCLNGHYSIIIVET
jgi:hypothetical protein